MKYKLFDFDLNPEYSIAIRCNIRVRFTRIRGRFTKISHRLIWPRGARVLFKRSFSSYRYFVFSASQFNRFLC